MRKMSRARLTITTALIVLAASSATVYASAGSTMTVAGPHHNALGQNFKYVISGVAGTGADRVVAWEQFNRLNGCAPTYTAEKARSGSSAYELTEWLNQAVTSGSHYSLVARFGAANAGQHGICAYLISESSGETFARGGAWWINGSVGGGVVAGLQPAPVGSGQCRAHRFADGSVYAQIATSGTGCSVADPVAAGADKARGAAYSGDGFSCKGTAEAAGSKWSAAWGGTYYAYSCKDGSDQVAFTWGTDYTY
jgi:hypothetical protein